jgi:predicted metalloprotease
VLGGRNASGCGGATAEIGPHYCPADENVYLDLGFFRELRQRFGAPGDFAQAYVMAHEIAHHVQHLMGIRDQVRDDSRRIPEEANELSVRLELQADCLAACGRSRPMNGACSRAATCKRASRPRSQTIGSRSRAREDRPRVWTHGSSEQRVRWFTTGYENGDPNDCDMFSAEAI